MEELAASEANPFWQRLLAPEQAYGVDMTKSIAPVLEKAFATGMSKAGASTVKSAFKNFTPAAYD